jgi:hypothetical protein
MTKQRLQKAVILFPSCIFFVSCLLAQTNLPVIKARSKNVIIRDGAVVKDWWYIVPEARPDIYWVDFPRKEQTVTFITDTDSISFAVKQGSKYDFVIVVNDKDSAFTQIAGMQQHQLTYTGSSGTDSIPFTVRDNRIYFDGTINGSDILKIQFDLGAGMSNINAKSTHKIKMNFDSSTYLINSQGRNKARLSTANEIALGKLSISPDVFVETGNMAKWEDAIVGNSLFLDKYLEIDYDKKMFIVHKSMPLTDSSWKRLDMQLDGGVRPMIEATLEIDGISYTDWYIFDTGDAGNAMLSNELTGRHGIYDKFSKLLGFGGRKIASMPKIVIAGYGFDNGTMILEKPNADLLEKSVLGNKILSRFNVIIDNRLGNLYLKPNQFFAE